MLTHWIVGSLVICIVMPIMFHFMEDEGNDES
jgi:hypothetical protein